MHNLHRSNLLYIFSGTLILLLLASGVRGKNSLDDYIFLSCATKSNISNELLDGYRAFIIADGAPIETILNETNSFLTKNKKEFIVIIFEKKFPDLSKLLKGHPINQFLATPRDHSFNLLKECKTEGKRFFIFMPGATPFSFPSEKHLCQYSVPPGFPAKIERGFSQNPMNDLVIFRLDILPTHLPDSLRQQPAIIPRLFNTYTGKLPNFLVCKQKEVFETYFHEFSKQKWYSANVEYSGIPLAGIHWKKMPLLTSFGKIHTNELDLSPQKKGYRFSPDIFTFNKQTSESTKIFYAAQKNIMDEMVLLLAFEKNVNNTIKIGTKTSYSHISYKKDAARGWCALFNGKDNYIDFDTDINFHENFTVSAWVKPTELKGNRSILGKGKALSVKFKDGNLLFTSPGIKDHYSDSAVVTRNEWQQLTYVISAGEAVRFYRNGKLVGIQEAAEIEPTEYSLLVGTNLWDESFKGLMDDLAIWNRTLSNEEVEELYRTGFEQEKKPLIKRLLSSLFFILLLISTYVVLSKSKRKKPAKKTADNTQKKQHIINEPQIQLFGGFRIVNKNNEDLTLRFSPKRKQIFILVLIETLRAKGISSKQLTNNLWAGYSSESAKNNRSTQIQRIREILKLNSGITIEYKNKNWAINSDADIYCDLAHYFQLMEHHKVQYKGAYKPELLSELLTIIEKGALLPNMEEEWLDNFKSQISNELLNTLLPLYANRELIDDTELALRLSHALLIFDPLNETLLSHKINLLIKLGKNTQAHEYLEHFEKVYLQCYNQPFGKSISDLLEKI